MVMNNYQPGDKINLDRFLKFKKEDPFKKTETLLKVLRNISNGINQKIILEHGLNELLNSDGTINTEEFSSNKSGPYSVEALKSDLNDEKEIELELSLARNEPNEEAKARRLKEWLKDKMKRKSTHTELLIHILLHRTLGENFIVARTAKIDDYKAGVDFIVINPTTGETICAFDGVAENDTKENEFSIKNTDKKTKKIENIAKNGGANIKYGLEVKNMKLERAPIKNTPVFYLSLSDKDFDLLSTMYTKEHTDTVNNEELEVFNNFIYSLKEQHGKLLKLNVNNPRIKEKIMTFSSTLDILKKQNTLTA